MALVLMVFTFMQLNVSAQDKPQPKKGEDVKGSYYCPMHKEIMSEHPGSCNKCGMNLKMRKSGKQMNMMDRIGNPFFEKSDGGLKVQVWLQTQDEHKQMMEENRNGMGHHKNGKGMKDGAMMQQMMSGTHHVMVKIIEEKTGKEVGNKVELQLNSPSQKSTSVNLMKREKHFGNGISLDEKGIYPITVITTLANKTNKVDFTYDVK